MSITMIGLDTAKSVFQVHAVDGAGQVVTRRKLRRNELIAFFEKQAACTVVMEACGAAHHWARMPGLFNAAWSALLGPLCHTCEAMGGV
jgi:transposase